MDEMETDRMFVPRSLASLLFKTYMRPILNIITLFFSSSNHWGGDLRFLPAHPQPVKRSE